MEEEEKQLLCKVPQGYAICLQRQCPKASTCLRQRVEQAITDDVEFWMIISPKRLATLSGECPYYRSNAKTHFAQGCMNMLNNMPHNQMQHAIALLKLHFGQRTYYRIRKGERLLNPTEQQEVLNILKSCGASGTEEFDAYIEDILW